MQEIENKKVNFSKKLKEYLILNKMKLKDFAELVQLSRYTIIKYKKGSKPTRRNAWKIFNITNGIVNFQDMQYKDPPKNPLKDI